MKKIVPVVICCICSNNKFLLTFRSEKHWSTNSKYNNIWNFPGGSISFGESPKDAIVREMKEELGVKITDLVQIPRVFTDIRKQWQGIFICFTAKISPNAKISLNTEATKWKWCTLEEIKTMKILPLTYEIAESAKKII